MYTQTKIMKDNTTILTIVTYGIILSAVSLLLNDIRAFDFLQFEEFQDWAKTAQKNEPWFTSKNAVKWSFYAISAGIFFWRAYLLYAFTYFLSILREIEKGNYFSAKNSRYFKKIANIFIYYTINVLVLRFLLALIKKSSFNFIQEFKSEFTLLIPCALAFYILAELFERAKKAEEENELTI